MIGRAAATVVAVVLFAAAAGPITHAEPGLAVRMPSGALRSLSDAALSTIVAWRRGQPGVEWSTVPISGPGEASSLTLVVARLDPRLVSLQLVWAVENDRPAWTVDRTPTGAKLSLNAGMFVEQLPWGWVVMNGRERLTPGIGPLSSALIGLVDGSLVWVDGDDVGAWRGRTDLSFAFQSYPTLLAGDGDVPLALREGTINTAHRDARLALGLDRQGRLLIALTRFDVAIPGADRLPFGLTVPEMATLMGSLGARQAMLLDGGISAQLAIVDSAGTTNVWKGLRKVPLALVAAP